MHRWFDARPASVSQSRRFAEEATADLAPEFREAIVLMVSELATNALVHATSGFEVRIERDATTVRTMVTDNGVGSPSLSFPDSTEPHGRGLLVVRELSDEWGTTVEPNTPGKTVWFSLDVTGGQSGESSLRALSRIREWGIRRIGSSPPEDGGLDDDITE
jgi:two-component sensor histidine kinase